MLYLSLLRFFGKEKGKCTVTLINRCSLILPRIQHKVVLLVLRTVFAVCFCLLNFHECVTAAL